MFRQQNVHINIFKHPQLYSLLQTGPTQTAPTVMSGIIDFRTNLNTPHTNFTIPLS